VNNLQRASAGLASATILFFAATLCAQADERPAVAMAVGSPSRAYSPARMKGTLYTQLPPIAELARTNGKALVQVALDDAGRVTNVTVVASSGNALLDRAALKTVRDATYEPASVGGIPVAGSFDIVVDFAPET